MNTFLRMLALLVPLFFLPSQAAMAKDYPTKIGEKLGTGISNAVTGIAEIPKTMILTSNRNGIAYGMTAGFLTGIVHAVGRTFSGALDLATFPIPTTSLVAPEFVWNGFDKETTYESWQMR